MDDPQNAPLPGYAPVPSRRQELILAILKFLGILLWVGMKILAVCVLFLVALITALAWKR